jgi:REP element-mobilizing transposase RayT
LRAEVPFRALRNAIARASSDAFRVVHCSIQPDHIHLLVEAQDKQALSRGASGLAIRLARRLNRAIRRSGSLWGDRWCSSASSFDGWRDGPFAGASSRTAGATAAETWLGSVGWRRHGLLSIREAPA